jgi:rubredoxin
MEDGPGGRRPASEVWMEADQGAAEAPYAMWQCRTCGYVYDEESGDPDEGLAPGTRWRDVPPDWLCPTCGTPKSDFDMVQL